MWAKPISENLERCFKHSADEPTGSQGHHSRVTEPETDVYWTLPRLWVLSKHAFFLQAPSPIILRINLPGRYPYCSHFTDVETEPQNSEGAVTETPPTPRASSFLLFCHTLTLCFNQLSSYFQFFQLYFFLLFLFYKKIYYAQVLQSPLTPTPTGFFQFWILLRCSVAGGQWVSK